jgi:hypothetical protein
MRPNCRLSKVSSIPRKAVIPSMMSKHLLIGLPRDGRCPDLTVRATRAKPNHDPEIYTQMNAQDSAQ